MKVINIGTFLLASIAAIFSYLNWVKSKNEPNKQSVTTKTENLAGTFISKRILGIIDLDKAEVMTRTYRNNISEYQTASIIYDTTEFKNYFYDTLVNAIKQVSIDSTKYKWKMALTPMYIYDNEHGEYKLTISVLPTIVSATNPNEVFDFWVEMKNNSDVYTNYYMKLLKILENAGKKSFIFDEGHLWP